MATEAQVSSAIVRGLQLCGHFAFKASDKYTSGVADILGVYSSEVALVHESVRFVPLGMVYAGSAIAIETKLVKEWPKRLDSKLLQHDLSRAQFQFLAEVNVREGLAYVAVAGPSRAPGVEVNLIDFNAWREGAAALDGKNVTYGWLMERSNSEASLMRGNLTKGFLASAGPLEATFK